GRPHAPQRLACDLLAQCPTHADRDYWSGFCRLGDRRSPRHTKSAHGLDWLCFAGHLDGVAGLRPACIAARSGGTAPRYWPVRARGDRIFAAAYRGIACQGAARGPELLRSSQICHCPGDTPALEVQHHEPTPLLQPLCAEPEWA